MPDRQAALRKYKVHADAYTIRFQLRTQESRRKNIARLELTNGEIVIDIEMLKHAELRRIGSAGAT
jgi:hypothetical protein